MSVANATLENVENSQIWERHQQIKFYVLISQGNIIFSKGLYCMENACTGLHEAIRVGCQYEAQLGGNGKGGPHVILSSKEERIVIKMKHTIQNTYDNKSTCYNY
jgi:hypothetical protein